MKILLLGFVCVFSFSSFGQTSPEMIEIWQRNHPTVTFISQASFDALSKDKKKLLGESYIVFDGKMTSEQINTQLKSLKSNTPNVPFSYDDPNAQLIKDWLGENSHIRIIKGELMEAKNIDVEKPNTLVYYGEFLTLKDIQDYEK